MAELADVCAEQALRLAPQLNRWATARVVQQRYGGDLSLRQVTALYLIRREPATIGHLARRMMVTPAVATGLIDRLEKRGYATRTNDPHDRRRIRLALTEAGKAVSVAVEQALVADIAARLVDFTPAELADLSRGLLLLDRAVGSLLAETAPAQIDAGAIT
jgi:DNA-binding MarR family transcriptional regulator